MRKFLVVFAVLAVGCQTDRFEIVPAGEGQAFRLDKRTGEVVYISMAGPGGKSTRVAVPEGEESSVRFE